MSHRSAADNNRGSPGNTISGIVAGPSVQALDIHGGVHFHGVPPAAATPHQAAAPPPHFAGRGAEVRSLRSAMDAGSTVVVLSGPGGVGKTALARQWARLAEDAFPAGQLYLNLGGFGLVPPVEPAEALRSFLRALGVPAGALPPTLAELTALYRSQTAGRSLLVVLDDAFSAAQVRVLVPSSSSSMTVITSRVRLSGLIAEGAVLLEITPLTTAESLTLLANFLGEKRIDGEREQAERLAELCAGLPIALCLAAARLSTRPRLSLARVVATLAAETQRLARLETPDRESSVSGSFELSYQALDASAAALYRRLSLHPGREFGLGPAAALLPGIQAGSPAGEADRLIGVLLESSLLQEVAEEHFRLHDLIHLHARQKVVAEDTEAVREEAMLAMSEWYLGAASAADVVVTPYRRRLVYSYRTSPSELPAFSDRDEALAWLDRQRSNLSAAGQVALDHRWAELAWHLSDVLWPVQLYRKSTDRKDIDVRGLAAARMWGDPRAEGRMLKRLGRTCTTLGEHDRAEQLLRKAVTTYAESGDAEGSVEAQEMLALAYRDSGRADAAAELLADVLATRRRLGNSRDIGLTLISLADLLSGRGNLAEAVELLREAGRLLDQSVADDPYNPVRVKLGLARAYFDGGDLAAADLAVTEAIEGMKRLGAAIGEADALELAARIAARRGDATRSRLCLQRAAELLETHGSPRAAALRRQVPAPPGVQVISQPQDVDPAAPGRPDGEPEPVPETDADHVTSAHDQHQRCAGKPAEQIGDS
ncbi:NTPase [Paractinoplanes durhamensis]|uniref:NTPase n=1 Tax=Paractinoplanes durhamensis TaxID=113563 RepID=A0ABQ3Z8P2_9ACTN|nr:NTPase [Actinoplanes durhamensis]